MKKKYNFGALHDEIKIQFDAIIEQARKQARDALLKPKDINSAIARARGKSKRGSREKFLEILNKAPDVEPAESDKL